MYMYMDNMTKVHNLGGPVSDEQGRDAIDALGSPNPTPNPTP